MDRFGRWITRTVPGLLVNFVWVWFVWWLLVNKLPWVTITTGISGPTQKELISMMSGVTLGISVIIDWIYFQFTFSTNIIGAILHQIFKMLSVWFCFWLMSVWLRWFDFVYPEGYSHTIIWFIVGSALTWLRVYDVRGIVLKFVKALTDQT